MCILRVLVQALVGSYFASVSGIVYFINSKLYTLGGIWALATQNELTKGAQAHGPIRAGAIA